MELNMRKTAAIVNKFNKLSFHDDVLLAVIIKPPQTKKNRSEIAIELRDDSTDKLKRLSFLDCANVRYAMDFDVMADNYYASTDRSIAKTDAIHMKKFVQSQTSHWRVQYMPPQPKDKPVKKKIAAINNYVLFEVAFFGGTIEVLAKRYTLAYEG
jgi:hypothetical protein